MGAGSLDSVAGPGVTPLRELHAANMPTARQPAATHLIEFCIVLSPRFAWRAVARTNQAEP